MLNSSLAGTALGPRFSLSGNGISLVRVKAELPISTEMALHVLAYSMKRVMSILGVGGLMEAIRASEYQVPRYEASRTDYTGERFVSILRTPSLQELRTINGEPC